MEATMRLFSVLFCVALCFLASTSQSAPHPGTSSSRLLSPKLGFFRSADGFRLHSGDSGWLQAAPPVGNQTILTVYRNPIVNSKASLTVRVDRLSRGTNTDRYITRWVKEYPRFGFDVLGSQPFLQGALKGHVIDLLNRDSKMQLRQVVFVNEQKKRAAILTCRDTTQDFSATLKSCNSIVRTFEW